MRYKYKPDCIETETGKGARGRKRQVHKITSDMLEGLCDRDRKDRHKRKKKEKTEESEVKLLSQASDVVAGQCYKFMNRRSQVLARLTQIISKRLQKIGE